MTKWVVVFGLKPGVIEWVRKLGYRPFLVDSENLTGVEDFKPFPVEYALSGRFEKEDFKIFEDREIAGVLGAYEDFVEMAAKFREAYCPHLPGLTAAQALAARDKVVMKRKARGAGFPIAPFRELAAETSWKELVDDLGSEIILKPRCSGAAIGIYRPRNESDWRKWRADHDDVAEYLAEAFLEEPREFCCDTIVSRGRIVAQFIGEYTVNCWESNQKHDGFGVSFPGFATPAQQEELRNLSRRLVEVFGLENAFCHIEFLMTARKIYFSEVGIRLPGGLQVPTESLMYGRDLTEDFVRLFIPDEYREIPVLSDQPKYFGYHLYPMKPGKVVSLKTDFDRPWIRESKMKVSEGELGEPKDSSVDSSGHVIYEARSLEELRRLVNEAPKLVKIVFA